MRIGGLLERRDVISEGQAFVHASKARVLHVARLAVQEGLISREIEPRLRALLIEACRDLADWDEKMAAKVLEATA